MQSNEIAKENLGKSLKDVEKGDIVLLWSGDTLSRREVTKTTKCSIYLYGYRFNREGKLINSKNSQIYIQQFDKRVYTGEDGIRNRIQRRQLKSVDWNHVSKEKMEQIHSYLVSLGILA